MLLIFQNLFCFFFHTVKEKASLEQHYDTGTLGLMPGKHFTRPILSRDSTTKGLGVGRVWHLNFSCSEIREMTF